MARYTQTSVERVRDAVDMADLVGSRTELRRSGANRLQGLCPFHDERTPSFGIDPVQKLYHCFGCGAGGDALKFVQETEGVDFKGALELLADRYGIELEVEEEDPREAEQRRARARLFELLDRTASYYSRVLWESPEAEPARRYLLERGLTEESLREFRIGYSPSAWDRVLMASRKAGWSNKEIYDAGLAQRGREGKIYDRFRARIMFPLWDSRGRVVGFGARAMSADRGPKYLNTSENEVFHKGDQVYAAHLARATAAKAGTVIVVEGYTDVIALHQAGVKNVVAIMGTSLTERQVKALRRLSPVALLALDADDAGQEAMLRAARVAGSEDLELRVVPLPSGSDPADIVQRDGPDAMSELLGRSMPFVRFRVERALKQGDLSSPEGKDRVLEDLGPIFATIPPSVLREELMRQVADRLDVNEQLAAQLIARAPKAPRGGAAPRGTERQRPTAAPQRPAPRQAPRQAPVPARDFGDPGPGDRPPFDESGFHAEEGGFDPRRAPEPDPAQMLARIDEVERRFLAFCMALAGVGVEALRRVDPEDHFTSPLTRRAAVLLRDHPDAPEQHVEDGDDELEAFLRELRVRSAADPATPADLDVQRLQLELRRIARRQNAVRASGEAGITELARRRQTVQQELNDAMERALQ